MSKKANEQKQTIIGIINPCNWDLDGNPTALKICATNEMDFLLIEDEASMELYQYLQQRVELSGFVSQVGEKTYIKVNEIKYPNLVNQRRKDE